MSMKYTLLLCAVALMVVSAATFAAVAPSGAQILTVATENFDEATAKLPAYTLSGNWAFAQSKVVTKTAAQAATTITPFSSSNMLVYNKNGNYPAGITPMQYATSVAYNCTGFTGVTLSFERWLGINDNASDQAVVQVSNDGKTWNTVWSNLNHSKAGTALVDSGWTLVSYDISAYADNQKAVYIRWGLASSASDTSEPSGWAIDNLVLTATGPDVAPTTATAGAMTASYDADGTSPDIEGLWKSGPAMVGTSGQAGVGAGPAANAEGVTGGTIVASNLGANYPATLKTPVYLQSGPYDLRGLTNTAIQYERWLDIDGSTYDRAAIEVHLGTKTGVTATTAFDSGAAAKLTASAKAATSVSMAYAVNTANYFQNVLNVSYNVPTLSAGDTLAIQWTATASPAASDWLTLDTITLTADDASGDAQKVSFNLPVGTKVFGGAPFGADDNPNVQVQFVLTTAAETSSTTVVTLNDVNVMGNMWTKVYVNPTTNGLDANGNVVLAVQDTSWTLVNTDISKLADGQQYVYARFSIGPTYNFKGTQYSGWNLDDVMLVSGDRSWSAQGEKAPTSLTWETTGPVTVTAKNTGTFAWDTTYGLYTVEGDAATVTNPGEPEAAYDLSIVELDPMGVIDRWSVAKSMVPVTGTVAPDATTTFSTTITAPPLSAVVYDVPVMSTVPADSALSVLDCDWNMGNSVDGAVSLLKTYPVNSETGAEDVSSIANAGILTGRFSDTQVTTTTTGTTPFWARYQIEELAGRVPLVVQGYSDGTYRPSTVITRDQIAVFVARALGLIIAGTENKGSGQVFEDVPAGYWAGNAIEACNTAGIVQGYSATTFDPTNPVTRDQMAVFIARAYAVVSGLGIANIPTAPATNEFADIQNTTNAAKSLTKFWAADQIAYLQNAGIVQGYAPPAGSPAGTLPTYSPSVQVTRDQLAVYIWRATMMNNQSFVALGGPAITADNPATASYAGYSDAPAIVNYGDTHYAYLTLDGVRLAPKSAGVSALNGKNMVTSAGTLSATFTLTNNLSKVVGASGTVTMDPAKLAAAALASKTGEPYANLAWMIPTSTAIGDYTMTTVVNSDYSDTLLARTTGISVVGQIKSFTFDDTTGLNGWVAYGEPQQANTVGPNGPDIYPISNAVSPYNAALFDGTGSLELQGTQQFVYPLDTTNFDNLNIALDIAGIGLGASDTVTVSVSANYGLAQASAKWTPVITLTSAQIATKILKGAVSVNLTNSTAASLKAGTPDGASFNPNFAISLSVNTSGAGRAYFDDLVVSGS